MIIECIRVNQNLKALWRVSGLRLIITSTLTKGLQSSFVINARC
jgi:hypothetical protein